MRVGQARKRDANEPAIVDALRRVGVKVQHVSARGFCDLIAYSPHAGLVLLEIKSSRGRMTPAQVQHRDDGWPVHVVRSVEDAFRACGLHVHGDTGARH